MSNKKLRWTFGHENPLPVAAPDGTISVRGLTQEHIDVVFQPIVDLKRGRTVAYEALARCRVPGLENPSVLFKHAVAEESCGRLGRIIRDVTFARAPDAPIFVNLHPEELAARWLVRPDDPICTHQRTVYLEITESAALEYFDLCKRVLHEVCQRTGARLVVDDLGAGYSNLLRIVELEPRVVKLDRALVTNVHQNKRAQILLKHLVRMCKELDARVVCEGVETIDELNAIRDAGADYAQGYLLARPAYPAPQIVWPPAP